MGTTSRQDSVFIDSVIPKSLLEDAIDWIKKNMEPEMVFGKDRLLEWAKDNYEE